MVCIDDIKKEKGFFVDDRNLNRLFRSPIESYSVISFFVGDILRVTDDKYQRVVSLYDTPVYNFLNDTQEGVNQYRQYCDHYRVSFRTEQCFNHLIEEMSSSDYDVKKGILVIDQYGVIADGQHRACILLKKYGPYYKVNVLRIVWKQNFIEKFRSHLKMFFPRLKNRFRNKKENSRRG